MAARPGRPRLLPKTSQNNWAWHPPTLSRSTAGVTRLLGLRKSDSKVTEEEIRSIIQEGAEDGEVQEVEQKIMGRVFSLGDRTVESIMTFRSELVWIDTAMTPEQIREQVNREPHNRYPVGEGSLDKLAGVVYLKDLFRHIDDPVVDLGYKAGHVCELFGGFAPGIADHQPLQHPLFEIEILGFGQVCAPVACGDLAGYFAQYRQAYAQYVFHARHQCRGEFHVFRLLEFEQLVAEGHRFR